MGPAASRPAIIELRLSHFRSHLRTEIAPMGASVALFGENGAGKTNILEAVSLLAPGRGLRRAATAELARRPERIGWKVEALLGDGDRRTRVETWAEPDAPRQLRLDGKVAPQLALGRLLRIVWLTPAMDRLWIEPPEGRRRFLDRVAMSFEPSHGEAVLAYEKAMRERNRLLRDDVRDPGWFTALEAQMAGAAVAVRENRRQAVERLNAAQAAGAAFPSAELSIVATDDPDALAPALARGRERDRAAGRTLLGPHRIDLGATLRQKDVPAADCSTGEQKALLISLVLANARALAALGTPPVLLLDEIGAHLDPGRRAALFDELRRLGGQCWMSGTEREVLPGPAFGATHYRISDAGGSSRIEPG